MRDYIIMTDSCCDLSQQEVEELELTVLPLSFTIEGKTLLNTPDHADMSPEEFFAKIAAGADCTTAAVNVGQFTDAMEKVLQEGKDILCVCFSSALSTTYQSACIAAEDLREKYPEAKILVIDSLSASRGQGMLLYRAVRERREKNLTIDELDAYLAEQPQEVKDTAADTEEYLTALAASLEATAHDMIDPHPYPQRPTPTRPNTRHT